MELVDEPGMVAGRPRPAGLPATQACSLAFIAHAGQKIVLRPAGPVPATLPRELRPGDQLGTLGFADLAAAFRGVVQLDLGTGAARIAGTPEGAPRRLSFRTGSTGVVALRALDGHDWSEDVPPGRPVFGLAPELLRSEREGVLVLEPGSLTASLESRASRALALGRPATGSRLLPPLLAALLLAAAAGFAGWWSLGGLPEQAVPAGGARVPPPPERPADALARLEGLAASTGDPALKAELAAIGETLRRERLAREREHGQAAIAAIKAGAQLARGYRRDVADVGRLERALGVCGDDRACRQQYEPALARAAAARELTRDAYVDLLRQVAETYPQALLENRLMAVEAQHGDLDEVGGVPDFARRFVAQVARWRAGSAADREAITRELLGD